MQYITLPKQIMTEFFDEIICHYVVVDEFINSPVHHVQIIMQVFVFNSLWPGDAIWTQRSESALPQQCGTKPKLVAIYLVIYAMF